MNEGFKKKDDIRVFGKLRDQFDDVLRSMRVLSSKKSNDPMNKFKLRFVNGLLEQANEMLDSDYVPDDSFKSFPDEDLPSYSDVVMILSQYHKMVDKFWHDSQGSNYSDGEYWLVGGQRISKEIEKW